MRQLRRAGAGCMVIAVLAVLSGGCGARSGAAELYPQLAEHAGERIDALEFTGGAPFSADTLAGLVATQPTRCRLLGLPICIPLTGIGREEHDVDPGVVAADIQRLQLFYRAEGYFGTEVRPEVHTEGDGVRLTFRILRSEPVLLDSLVVVGTEGVLAPDSLARTLPLQAGGIFDLGSFAASADTILHALQARGHAYAQLLRNFTVDTTTDRATVRFEALPGPRVRVDSIAVAGATHLGRAAAVRQLTVRPGDLLVRSDLIESQRNLYNLPLVRFATVSVAADSLGPPMTDSAGATVQVRIAEVSVHQVDAAVGYGSVDCFRAQTQWQSRSFGGGARQLILGAAVSKLGIATGLSGTLCRAFRQDSAFANALDYRLSAELTQPYFLGPRNNLTLNLFVERESQPRVFQRQAQGGRLGLTRRVSPRTTVTGAVDVEYGSTQASPALFCGALQVCEPGTIDVLTQPRFRNTLSATMFKDHTDAPLNPTRGYSARTGIAWAPPWLLSDITFVRWTGQLSVYRPVRPGWVAAATLQLGNFFQTASLGRLEDYLPPEERFFAGGANSVRGYDQNSLGPGVYVTSELVRDSLTGRIDPEATATRFVPTGGTSLAILDAELRTPSPWLSDVLRFAFFVDAGAVGTDNLFAFDHQDLRVTPGAGVRLQTPVGPVRLDLAYNPYALEVAPLYRVDPDTGGLERVTDRFEPPDPSFLSRLQLHIAVGQAF